jgi:hypothetical protein
MGNISGDILFHSWFAFPVFSEVQLANARARLHVQNQ